MMRVWRLSDVCLSVAYIGPKSWTEKPRKTKIGTEVAHVMRDSGTTFKVRRSKINLQGLPAQLDVSMHCMYVFTLFYFIIINLLSQSMGQLIVVVSFLSIKVGALGCVGSILHITYFNSMLWSLLVLCVRRWFIGAYQQWRLRFVLFGDDTSFAVSSRPRRKRGSLAIVSPWFAQLLLRRLRELVCERFEAAIQKAASASSHSCQRRRAQRGGRRASWWYAVLGKYLCSAKPQQLPPHSLDVSL